MTVYISNAASRFDYRPATRFGELEFVTDRVFSMYNPAINDDIMKRVDLAAAAFDASTDYVLPSGSAVSTGLLFAALALRGHRDIPVLLWSGNDLAYVPAIVSMSPLFKEAR